MTRWEYQVIEIPDGANPVSILNVAGQDGWEFTGYASDNGFSRFMYMKREAQWRGENVKIPYNQLGNRRD